MYFYLSRVSSPLPKPYTPGSGALPLSYLIVKSLVDPTGYHSELGKLRTEGIQAFR